MYAYAGNNPISFSDPFGLTCRILGNCLQSDGGLEQLARSERSEQLIQGLRTELQEPARNLLRRGDAMGIELQVFKGFRTNEEQDKLFAQGRHGSPGQIVTNARGGESYHNYGLAIDVVEYRGTSKSWGWTSWNTVDKVGESLGFRSGAAWGDFDHFQMTGGRTISAFQGLVARGLWRIP